MAIADITKPIALDETLQSTNGLLGTQNGKLDSIVTAIMSISLASVGNVNSLTTTDKTSLVGAVNELNAGKVSTSSVGVAGGVAELDNTGKVPASQLPAFVDDVIEGYLYNGNFYEDSAHTQLITPEDGKIYIDLVSNKTYRWSGSQYTVISDTLALGETSTTAYRGDRGKAAYDHSQDANRTTSAVAEGLYKIGATAQGHISSATAVTKGDITALGLVGSVTASTTNGNILVDNVEVTAYDDSDVVDDITEIQGELSTDTTQAIGNPISFSTLTAQNASECIIDLDPIQDLHGYDKPWVGGAGKNLLPMVLANIKSENTDGTWNGNVYSQSGLTFEVKTDSANNVIGILVKGTATTTVYFSCDSLFTLPNGSYIKSGCPSGGSGSTYFIGGSNSGGNDTGSGATFTSSGANTRFVIVINNGYAIATNGLLFQPMCRLASISDSSFAPYTNLCPITGRTQVGIGGCGFNICSDIEAGTWNGSTQEKSTQTNRARSKDIIRVKPSTKYTISATALSNKTIHAIYCTYNGIGSDTLITNSQWSGLPVTFTTESNAEYVTLTFRTSDNADDPIDYITNVQLEEGQTATTYSPYTESTNLTISFGQTVYGGQVDVEKGILVVDRKLVDLSNYTWLSASRNRWHTGEQSDAKGSDNKNNKNISEKYESTDNTTLYNDESKIGFIINSYKDIVIRNGSTTETPTGSMVYELATPTTIQLTPHQIQLLKGVNNIFVSDDYSTITLTYRSGEVATLGDLLDTENKMLAKQHVYSTDEQIVGTWIDGKPVYEKTITLESAMNIDFSSWTNTNVTVTNGLQIIKCVGISNSDGSYAHYPLMGYFDSNKSLNCLIGRYSVPAYNVKYIVLQYTKST